MISNITFGEALVAVQQGKRIAREGWNGKNMFVFQRPSDDLSREFIIDKVKSLPESFKQFLATRTQETVKFGAYLCMWAADGSVVNGWLASQTDMLATDWCVLD